MSTTKCKGNLEKKKQVEFEMTDSNEWQLAAISFIGAFQIMQIIVLLALLYQLIVANNPIPRFFKYMTIICIIFCCMSSTVDLTHLVIAHRRDELGSDPSIFGLILAVSDTTASIASISLYIFLIGKLYITFKETKYKISKKYMSFLILLLLICCGCMAGFIFTFVTHSITLFHRSVKFVYMVILIDILINIYVLALFIYKLQQILMDSVVVGVYDIIPVFHQSHSVPSRMDTQMSDTVRRHTRTTVADLVRSTTDESVQKENQTKMTALIIRQTLLGCCIILFNGLFWIKVLCDIYFIGPSFPSDLAFQSTYCLRAVQNLIVITMLYLNFKFNTKLYYKCCGCCHNGCYKCCMRCTRSKVYESTMEPQMSVYHRL